MADMNPETMSLADLRAMILKEAQPEPTESTDPAPVPVQARDSRGRWSNADELPVPPDEADEVENLRKAYEAEPPQTFVKEIDNGNGVIERFQGNSWQELVDKIAEGKRNASIKIRELSKYKRAGQPDH
jgi:hypothetical protein